MNLIVSTVIPEQQYKIVRNSEVGFRKHCRPQFLHSFHMARALSMLVGLLLTMLPLSTFTSQVNIVDALTNKNASSTTSPLTVQNLQIIDDCVIKS